MTAKVETRVSAGNLIESLPKNTQRDCKALLVSIATELIKRNVPGERFIKLNLATGDFVTGKSADEADRRFEQMHPGVIGWMERLADMVCESGNGSSDKLETGYCFAESRTNCPKKIEA